MDDAEGFVVHGNKKAWVKYAFRATLFAIAAADICTLLPPRPHPLFSFHMPLNVIVAIIILIVLTVEAELNLLTAISYFWKVSRDAPLISVTCDGIQFNGLGWRGRRLSWNVIQRIYIWQPQPYFGLFSSRFPRKIVVVPNNSEAFYWHLKGQEGTGPGTAKPKAIRIPAWIGASEDLMNISPEKFMSLLNDYYANHAWRPGLPGGPFPAK